MSTNDTYTPTILVVDDDEVMRNVLISSVTPLGVNIIEAENGRTALTILKKQPIDVVISDLIMPRMSGLMLLHSLLEQGHHLPFVLVTSFSDKDSAVQALRLGAFDYLEKPIAAEDLQSVVKEAIQAGREQRQLITMMNTQPDQNLESIALAEMQILRMRTFRAKRDEFNQPVTKGNTNNWQDLRNLFVSEAEPQLMFCQGSIENLSEGAVCQQELGYLLRSIQSVRLASEAIRLTHISDMAWSVELFLAALKSKQEALKPEQINLLKSALADLNTKISALTSKEALRIQTELDKASQEIRTVESHKGQKSA